MSRPATIRTLELQPGSPQTDLRWSPSAPGLQKGNPAVTRYEVRRVAMGDGVCSSQDLNKGGFCTADAECDLTLAGGDGDCQVDLSAGWPGRDVGTGVYSGLVAIAGDKYNTSGTAIANAAGPICDTSDVGDDEFFDCPGSSFPPMDSMELPCHNNPTIPCYTDKTEPVDLTAGGDPIGYFYAVVSGMGNSTASANSPGFRTPGSHSSRPNTLPAPAACPACP